MAGGAQAQQPLELIVELANRQAGQGMDLFLCYQLFTPELIALQSVQSLA
jgi:hypothetical protein